MYDFDARAIDLYFSSACNMACTYCYIHKDLQSMNKYNAVLRDKIVSGDYAKIVIERFKDRREYIDSISLWGAEPTINTDILEYVLYPLLDYFPKVRSLMYSTNALVGYKKIYESVETINKYGVEHNRDLLLTLQFSIDGPAYINDASRHVGATENSVNTIRQLSELIKDIPLKIDISIKPTLDTKFMKMMNEDTSLFLEYYKFFDDIVEENKKILENSNSRIYAPSPTIVNPGYHTQEDGKIFAQWIRNLSQLDTSSLKNYSHRLFNQISKIYSQSNMENKNALFSPHIGSCSAGRSAYGINMNGDIFMCHRLFRQSYAKDNKNAMYSATTIDVPDSKFDEHLSKLKYTASLFHTYKTSRISFAMIIIKTLARYGQIDKKYLDNDEAMVLIEMMWSCGCHYGQLEDTGSMYAVTTSYLRLLGNGAADAMMEYMSKYRR